MTEQSQVMPMHTVVSEQQEHATEQPVTRRFSGGLFATKLSVGEAEKLGNEHSFGRLIAIFSVQATSLEEAEGIVLAKHWTPKKDRVDFKGTRPHFRHDSYKTEQGESK